MLAPWSVLAPLLLATAPASGPTLAVEDTMRTEVPEVLVHAPRVTLDEILDRVARGEARRESLLTDQSFHVTLRMTGNVMGEKEPRRLSEIVWKVYRKRPDRVRSVELRRWEYEPRRGGGVRVTMSPGMGEDIVNFAFQPQARRSWRYRILGREVIGGHLVYRLGFEPRSRLGIEPSGEVWVDTNDFVIVREEVFFRQSPVPLILKGVPRMVVERRRVGEHWLLSRVLMRAELTLPWPRIGKSVDLAILYGDYLVNAGIDDSRFEPDGRR